MYFVLSAVTFADCNNTHGLIAIAKRNGRNEEWSESHEIYSHEPFTASQLAQRANELAQALYGFTTEMLFLRCENEQLALIGTTEDD